MIPTITVVGLGPGDARLLASGARDAILAASVARLRTRRHPAAEEFADVLSYDDWYEGAESFELLYAAIVDDLVELAHQSGDVVFAVPGSPVVAERTVELLLARDDVRVVLEPAISVIDAACAALARDPMAAQLRVVDALASSGPLLGPGPLLVLQTYSREVMALLADRMAPGTEVVIVHHVGLDDQLVVSTTAERLSAFEGTDHLTSVWVESVRSAGVAIDDLVALTHTLREQCPWDQEQTHGSLLRHLLEESYETIDALERYVANEAVSADPGDVVEELGDLLFQIAFHAELGSEDGQFDFADIADHVRVKLISRHPHVFGDVTVVDSDDVATRWETLKREEKGRTSVTDGIPTQLPSLTLYAKLRRKSMLLDMAPIDGTISRDDAIAALRALPIADAVVADAVIDGEADERWDQLLSAISDLARWSGVDLESVLRRRALALRDEILAHEAKMSSNWPN